MEKVVEEVEELEEVEVKETIFVYLITTYVLKCKCNHTEEMLSKAVEDCLTEMNSRLTQFQSNINDQKTEKPEIAQDEFGTTSSRPTTSITRILGRQRRHKLAYDYDTFEKLVTVISYRARGASYSCLESKKKDLRRVFQKLSILSVNSKEQATIGFQFNSLISKVKTTYFLFLDSRHDLMDHTSDHSAGWLLHAMENVPELDFVSGSILDQDKLEIPCYRLKLCNWTLSQSYEYKKSMGDMMMCDSIASSFMGRTSSIRRIQRSKEFLFDENITSLSTTDFFLTVKRAGAICGVRPEVIFEVTSEKKCIEKEVPNRREKFQSLLPFAHKHKIFRFRDPDSNELDLCDRDSPIVGEDICDEPISHKVMLDGGHWAYDGTFAYPYMIKNLQHCLFKVADFLTFKNIPFSIIGGVALGAVKMRGVLPWDAGDIDMVIYNYSLSELHTTMAHFARKHHFTAKRHESGQVQVFCAPHKIAEKVGGLVSMFVSDHDVKLEFVKIMTNGRWIPYRNDIFSHLREHYSVNYLQHKMYRSSELIHCKKKGHNACLPDFRHDGKAGTFKEYFCEL
ncbi:hypothetical protein QZH41_006557 [Actinostola sp. cb2023]|nr:hypothetical protein QZH41_006557 [Actinostola sp. cb2023]